MEALGINLGYLILQALAILVLILLLKGWLYGPVLRVLEDRKARIAKGLEDARQAAIARDNADAEARKILDQARAEAAKLRQDAAVQAEEQAASIVAKANQEGKDIVAKAREDAEEERNQILSELRGQVAAIAIAAAQKLVGETLDEKRQHQLISDFFAKVPAGVRDLQGDAAEVTSALPLSEEEKASIKKTLKVSNVNFKIEPDILGGLIVRVGDRVVDASVVGKMDGLRESLR
ncbi:MAG: F0F1 ATP synthase subunit B [Chloroflexi bacterium]|nr:F0F1 ATP synthase subunit B [Chloroflexota bacterium]MCI0649442.1 F0F1 ATP synthase subunit B [Chloroflexota bacterium]MCI0730758.1 F0F1 ATP synthase subunit B [Chloroflexota bacterium]